MKEADKKHVFLLLCKLQISCNCFKFWKILNNRALETKVK